MFRDEMTANRPDQTATEPEQILRIEGLDASVRVYRDQYGIPHIRAASQADCFFANGYVHAQDRLWQMDAARRRAVGRLAEWTGKSAVEADMLARRLDVEGASRRDAEALSAETAAMLERYTAGVNAYIASGSLPAEYKLLGETPEPWEPWQCVAVMRQRGILMGSVWFKLWRAAAVRTIGADNVAKLRYDDGDTDTFIVPQGKNGQRWIAALEELSPALDAINRLAATDATVGGSNNWTISGERTASGKPLVAGDPHRAFEIPGMYAQMHLTCPEFDAIGFTVPGVPAFPHFCHTEKVVWCVTHTFADLHDLYVERFAKDDPTSCEFCGEWEKTSRREETVRVRGGGDVRFSVTTTRHGPVIVGKPEDGHAVALRSVQLDRVDRSLDCLIPMLKAPSLDSFYEATRGWGVIDHNLVAADTDGHIGVLVRAIVPDRDRLNGWLPVPGWTGDHEWRGVIPWEHMPREIDPSSGMIVTANNKPAPDDYAYYLCTDCHPSTRARRIAERLPAEGATIGGMEEVLRDTYSARALEFRDALLRLSPDKDKGGKLLAILGGWDGQMEPGLIAPSVYMLVRQEMTRVLGRLSGLDAAARNPLARVAPGIPALNQLWWTLPNLLRAGDETMLAGKTWDDVMAEALATVATRDAVGPWGLSHRPVFVHPLAEVFPDKAADLAPSSDPAGGDGDCVFAVGAYPSGGLPATYGSVARYVFDVSNWDRSRWVVFHGTSGHPGSAHYSDQNALWARGEMVPAPYSADAVEAHAVSVTRLEPIKSTNG
jgi:penicillin amidase